MADKKISELTEDTNLTGTEQVPINDGGVTKRTTAQAIADLKDITGKENVGVASGLVTTHESTYTHADIAHSNRAALDAVSGTNTGDETVTTIKTKLGITTLSGSNTGDQDLSGYSLTSHNHTGVYEAANANIQSHISSTSNPHSTTAAQVGAYTTTESSDRFKAFHGIVSRATVAPLPTSISTTTFTITTGTTPLTYYLNGTKVIVSTDQSTTLAGTAGIYFIYFDSTAGTLTNSTVFPDLTTTVLVASVVWNGTNLGLVNDERHGYTRNLAWHSWAHNTVGVRYKSGLDLLTLTGTGAAATMTLGAGEIRDEDIAFSISASASFATPNAYRHFYQTGASTYAFVNTLSTVPFYRGANNRPYVVDTTGYVLTEVPSAANRYVNFFVYATSDVLSPIYIFTETVTTIIAGQGGYTSAANARAVPWPNLSGFGLSAEMKPIYRVIVRADGVVQATTAAEDYRTVSSLPMAAGTTSTTASAVSFVASGNIAATTVQTAIEELDLEKAPLASPTFTGTPAAPTGTDYTTMRIRNAKLMTATPVAGDFSGDGEIIFVYTP